MDKSDIVVKITYRKRRVDLTMTGQRDVKILREKLKQFYIVL